MPTQGIFHSVSFEQLAQAFTAHAQSSGIEPRILRITIASGGGRRDHARPGLDDKAARGFRSNRTLARRNDAVVNLP